MRRILPLLLFIFILFTCSFKSMAQRVIADARTKPTLYDTISRMDSLMFDAFTRHDANKLVSYFTTDLEFYHDKGGLTNYEQNLASSKNMFSGNTDIRRTLVPGSMSVFPVPGFGAIQEARHMFCHTEDGKQVCGTFKFIHIWKNENGTWKIARVVSFDH